MRLHGGAGRTGLGRNYSTRRRPPTPRAFREYLAQGGLRNEFLRIHALVKSSTKKHAKPFVHGGGAHGGFEPIHGIIEVGSIPSYSPRLKRTRAARSCEYLLPMR